MKAEAKAKADGAQGSRLEMAGFVEGARGEHLQNLPIRKTIDAVGLWWVEFGHD